MQDAKQHSNNITKVPQNARYSSVRVPQCIAKTIKREAVERDTTVQGIVTEAVCLFLKIDNPFAPDAAA